MLRLGLARLDGRIGRGGAAWLYQSRFFGRKYSTKRASSRTEVTKTQRITLNSHWQPLSTA